MLIWVFKRNRCGLPGSSSDEKPTLGARTAMCRRREGSMHTWPRSRFTEHGSRSLCGCCGYAWFCPVGGDALGAPTGPGATPQAEGLVRARGQVCVHTLAPRPGGRSRSNYPSREGHRAPLRVRRTNQPARRPVLESRRLGSSRSCSLGVAPTRALLVPDVLGGHREGGIDSARPLLGQLGEPPPFARALPLARRGRIRRAPTRFHGP